MIDFHTHIIPNIDDGSRNIDETISLIEEAKRAGFDEIILTSHYKENVFEVDEGERKNILKKINKILSVEEIECNLHIANEIYITGDIIELLEDGKASTINGTNYVLFEMPFHSEPQNLYDVIYEMLEHKLIPVLAHPERYSYVQKNPELIYDLIEKGILMQSNYGSVLGLYGKNAKIIVRKLLENNLVHFLGTDVHRQNTIYPLVKQSIEKIESIIGKERLEELTTINPKLALSNKAIEIRTPIKFKLGLKEKIQMNF